MNKTIESLYLYFETVLFRFGDDILLPLPHCNEFIKQCQKNRIAILGVKGFSVSDEGKRMPILNEIADFSTITINDDCKQYINKTTLAATRFIQAMDTQGNRNVYSFVLRGGNGNV